MNFKSALWDGSDPLYTPCSSYSRKYMFWKAPAKYRKLGYKMNSFRLPGERGDGQNLERAQKARELTREMLKWFEGDTPSLTIGTVKWLVARYQNDDISPFNEVKASTKPNYRHQMQNWENAAGAVLLKHINYERLMLWKNAMVKNGRSIDYISRAFRHLRLFINYGVLIEDPECNRISIVLSKFHVKQPKPKKIAPTPGQVMDIIEAAERAGDASYALGLRLQWWYHLSPIDVRGQYLPLAENEARSGIIKGNKRWADGLDWSMIDRDVTFFEKTRAKTEHRGAVEYRYDLTIIPEIRDALLVVPKDKRVGPVILKPASGLPYSADEWSRKWRHYADQVGVPYEVKVMDIRAGALTHGSEMGATRTQLKNAAGHTNEDTTERYIRTGSDDLNKVVKMRREQ